MTSFEACLQELLKLAHEASKEEALGALDRLEGIERARPTAGQMARGAIIGGAVGPAASAVGKLISHGHFQAPREALSQAVTGALAGSAVPFIKNRLESTAERRMLRNYVDQGVGGRRLATQIEQKLGTPP